MEKTMKLVSMTPLKEREYPDKQTGELRKVRMEIDIDSTANASATLFNLTSEVNKCLVINRTSLTPRRK